MANHKSSSAITEDTFDDACDLGQCCMDPCYFLYVKTKKLWDRRCQSKLQPQQQQQQQQHPPQKQQQQQQQKQDKDDKAAFLFTLQQTTYYLLMTGGWTIILSRAFPLLHASDNISNRHGTAGIVVLGACITSWLLAKFTSPGTITQETLWKYDNYRYDGILYQQQQHDNHNHNSSICPTSHVRKLARSKYDRYSHQQVPRFDHFCGWLGNSIGEENYRFFLLFVAVHTFMSFYGAIVTFAVMKDAAETSLATIHTTTTTSWYDVFLAALKIDASVMLVVVLMILSLPIFISFLGFHVLLVRRNMTTNEYFKWKTLEASEASLSSATASDLEQASRDPCPPDFFKFGSSQAPSHFYNLGFTANVHEVIFPRSMRGGGVKTM